MGDAVDSLCVIRSGTVLLERHGVSRALGYCDYFGEGAVAQVRVRVRVRVRNPNLNPNPNPNPNPISNPISIPDRNL